MKSWYGMHPLTVTWAPFIYTDIGFQNFRDFVNSGFANLMAFPNGKLHRKLARIAFEAVGDVFLPFIFGQLSYSFHIALKYDVKLVFYGENGEAEYGGSTKNNYRPYMPLEDWADMYFKGVTVDDLILWGLERGLIEKSDYNEADLTFYKPPPLEQLADQGVQMHWFSYYHKWLPQENYYYSVENTGFQANTERSEGTYSKYASIDDKLDGFHYYFSYIKFGLGRATSDAAHEIRDGHLTREEGVALVKRFDGEFPKNHFQDFLQYIDITEEKFWEVVDRFRQPHIWKQENGEWKLRHVVSDIQV
jgi:N-acetyl sugar amidotransferase